MKTKLLYVIISLVVILTACKKDESTEVIIKGALARIKKGGEVSTEYAYLLSGQLSSKRTFATYTKFTYDSGEKLEKTEYFEVPKEMPTGGYSSDGYGGYSNYDYGYGQTSWIDPEKMTISYTELFSYNTKKQMEQLTLRYEGYNTQAISKFSYNDRGLIAKQEGFKQEGYIEFAYDVTGNLKKKSQFMVKPDGATHLLLTSEYEFDQMHNPFLYFKNSLIPGQESNINNIIKETFIRYDSISSNVVQNTIEQHIYEYNELGYPVSRDDEYTFEYH